MIRNMSALLRCLLQGSVAAAVAISGNCAWAQNFPQKLVRITEPYSSGGGPDLVARLFADRFSKLWKHQVIVDSRPGASGFLAFDAVKKAQPDGHDLLLSGNAQLTINPSFLKSVPYDPERDFVPVALLYRTPFFLAVSSNGPFSSVRDVIASAKAQPGKMIAAVPYIGSPAHIGGATLDLLIGAQTTQIAFRENGPLFSALSNNDLSWSFTTPATAGGFLRNGKVKFLAVAARHRSASRPDIPTFEEAGGPAGLEISAWVAFLAPKGTPPDIVAFINRDVSKVLADAEVRERFAAFGFEPATSTPAELGEMIRNELRSNAEIIKRSGIRPD